MFLGLGPVARYELTTTARRGRYYFARTAYGMCLLYSFTTQFMGFERAFPEGATPEQVRRFTEDAFIAFGGIQGYALLALIPALVAGAIADDYQRKTLHYLLASRLTSAEIVFGKLTARLLHAATFVALGIPVVCLLALHGGLNPENVFYVYLGTLTTSLLLASVSILISIVARRPRDAILITYGLEAVWLILPPALEPTARYFDGVIGWIEPVNRWVMATNPLVVWQEATDRYSRAFGPTPPWLTALWASRFTTDFYWMVGLQAGCALILLLLAIVGLRPLRGTSWPGSHPRRGWWARLIGALETIAKARAAAPLTRNEILREPRNRRACGDDPMLWKELHTSAGGGLKWLRSRPVLLFFGVLLGCYLLDVSYPILIQILEGRWARAIGSDVYDALRGPIAALAVLGMLAVAAAAAISVTGEREQDTWTSLATTLLRADEIIRAKQLGALWSAWRVWLALLTLWLAGIVLGGIHPLSAAASALFIAFTAWLVASIGVMASAAAKNSTRALVVTFVVVLGCMTILQWHTAVWDLQIPYSRPPARTAPSYMPAPGAWNAVSPAMMHALIYGLIGVLFGSAATRRLRATWGR
jgi:ABC-type transport system involved in multi-copper enzyme maturation permease subunit